MRKSNGTLGEKKPIFEIVYAAKENKTAFAIYENGETRVAPSFTTATGETLTPVAPGNNLIQHRAVLFAENPEDYQSVPNLAKTIQDYLYRYVDLSDQFRAIASYYVLLTWVYDAFNELPYLRLRGDFGSGKTRALKVIGSICNKPFFASGASTVSPIFHVLDTFRGTLIFDEADFRFSDEKAEIIKIFNNGNVKGFPVLRTAMTAKKEFDPRAFHVFGPKIVAMRRSFSDDALESRFLTEEMGQHPLRKDIPINLPEEQEREALALRKKLLMYRFKNLHRLQAREELVDPALSPRLNQILVPLLSVIEDEELRQQLRESVKSLERNLYADRSASVEGNLLEVLSSLMAEKEGSIPISDIAIAFLAAFGEDYDRPITNKFIGGLLRKRLHLATFKSHGVYVLPECEREKVSALCARFGVIEPSAGRLGDMGTSPAT